MKKGANMDEQLDAALRKPLEYQLPDDFSKRIIQKIELREKALDRKANLILWGSTFGFVVLAAICFVLFSPNEILVEMLDISGWAVLIGLLVVVFQVLDNRLLRKKLPGSVV